jgi:CheY-like chemotaxis protein/anti-sigma regulatory factor (Ser/Thr protein kinase)
VLDVSRIETGKIRLNVQPVSLATVIEGAIATVLPAADARAVRIEAILDPMVPLASGDPDRLQQVVWNLLTNAVKFTPKGGRVQVRLERVNSHVEIVVSDTGAGIGPEFLPFIFERFRQGDSRFSREHGGLGLGLAITKSLVEMHGGTIQASSEGAGRGTTFRVRLPLRIVDALTDREAERVHPRTRSDTQHVALQDLSGIHVLAVDDDPDALLLLKEVLEAAGAEVTTARSADEAMGLIQHTPAHVLISDLGMPGTDGFGLIGRIRDLPDPARRSIPAAALTAYARSEDRTRVLQSGFQMHLAKPISPAELAAAVRSLAARGPSVAS